MHRLSWQLAETGALHVYLIHYPWHKLDAFKLPVVYVSGQLLEIQKRKKASLSTLLIEYLIRSVCISYGSLTFQSGFVSHFSMHTLLFRDRELTDKFHWWMNRTSMMPAKIRICCAFHQFWQTTLGLYSSCYCTEDMKINSDFCTGKMKIGTK